jgi:hypothetical protein
VITLYLASEAVALARKYKEFSVIIGVDKLWKKVYYFLNIQIPNMNHYIRQDYFKYQRKLNNQKVLFVTHTRVCS